MTEQRRKEILELNEQQAKFYNELDKLDTKPGFNWLMRLWRFVRRRMYFLMKETGMQDEIVNMQKEFLGDLTRKKVLDFGCFEGNQLSMCLAENSADYLGIDLSKAALNHLEQGFKERGLDDARVQAVDVLSDDFTEGDFDVIYAQGVMHHFNPIDVLLPVLHKKLKSGGRIVSLDPLQASLMLRIVRIIYHPFRSDREWEWPFKRATFKTIRKYFEIHKVQGFVGKSKWAIPFVFINKKLAIKIAKKLHNSDLAEANKEGAGLWRCMQVVMCLEKKETSRIG